MKRTVTIKRRTVDTGGYPIPVDNMPIEELDKKYATKPDKEKLEKALEALENRVKKLEEKQG